MSTLGTPAIFDGNSSDDALFKTRPDELYWLATKEGWFVHRPMVIGQAFLRHTPTHLPEFPYKNGIIFYDFPRLTKELMSQAIDFFKRIYERDHSEAEVIIVHNPAATPPVKLFVPPQKCSGGSVNSAFNPEHIGKGWQIIGSIHSHCNFSAFHSGTDTGDAAEFDGLHITIGDILKDAPSYAAMVMVNRQRVDYKIETIADVSDLKADTAPAHWDRFVLTPNNTNPKIEATWQEFKSPPRTEIKYHREDLRPAPPHGNGNNWQRGWHQAAPVAPVQPSPNMSKRERKRLAKLARQAVRGTGSEYWHNAQANRQNAFKPNDWECDQCFCREVNHPQWNKQPCPTCRHKYGRWTEDSDDRDYAARYSAAAEEMTDEEWSRRFEEKFDIKPRRNPDIPHDQIAFDIINEFYEMFAEITELGIYASDLIPSEDLLTPEEINRIKMGLDIQPVKNVTPPPVAEGQVTIDDVLGSN